MKKKLLSFIFAICLIIPCVFMLSGCKNEKESTKPEEPIASIGLEYELINDGTEYSVKSVGTCKDANIVIPATYEGKPVVIIGESAFESKNITSIKIPNSITSIEDYAFQYCIGLTNVNIPSNVDYIGNYVFQYCGNLTDVEFANNSKLTYIGVSAFNQCGKLANITIPKKVTYIGEKAFYLCGALTSINIPNTVVSIGDHAFQYCVSLSTVTFSNDSQLNSIGVQAFYGCEELTSIYILRSVNYMGANALAGCGALSTIYIHSESDIIEDMTDVLQNFTKDETYQSDYDKYVKKS